MSGEVTRWLEGVGLGQYANVFIENAIDVEVLADLTDADLRELGMPLGHRKRLLKAISAAPAADAVPVSRPAAWSRTPGERKPVTLLFADLTGSTALTEHMDSEDAHDFLYGAAERMCRAVEANRGTVCRYMGDGVMAMFGAPVASEHHALQACAAALAMQAAVAEYAAAPATAAVRIRVGLHSGEAVILRVGAGRKVEYDASGPAVPMAARMEQSAAPGSVQISAATRALAGERIEAEALPPVRVKGISDPVEVFRLQRLRAPGSAVAQGPFVGRRAERAQFEALLDACLADGHGQVVHVRGEPGVGKTRMVREFCAAAEHRGMHWHRGLVLDFGTGAGGDAIRTLARSLLAVGIEAEPAQRARSVEHAVRGGWIDADQQVFLHDLLDLVQPPALRGRYDAMDNAVRNEGKRRVMRDLVAGAAGQAPLLLVIEDLHWADGQTLAHAAALAAATTDLPALLVLTSRITGDPVDAAWRASGVGAALATMDLGPLRDSEAEALARDIVDAGDPRIRQCIERAGGNPLFLEQLLRDVREDSGSGIPDSIQSLVLARMDRLEPRDKAALQAAAVIGQRFDAGALAAVSGDAGHEPARLVAQRLVLPEGGQYLFAHALIRDGVYASLVKPVRGALHRRAADWFAGRDPVLHAQHLERAGDPGAAAAFLGAARAEADAFRAERARDLCVTGRAIATNAADRYALACLEGGLCHDLGEIDASAAAYEAALEDADGDVECCRAWIGLAAARRVSTDYDAALELLERAEPVARAHHLTLDLARLHDLRGNLYFPTGRIDGCRDEHQRALECAREAGSLDAEASALGGLGDAAYARGHMHTALDYFGQCLALARREGFGRIESAYASMLPFSHLYLCQMDTAIREGRAALAGARAVGALRAEMNAIGGLCHVDLCIGDYARALENAAAGLAIAEHLGAGAWRPLWDLWSGMALHYLGRHREAIERITPAANQAVHHFNAGRALGALAVATNDRGVRDAALARGEVLLAEGTVSHNHFWFYRLAMEAMIECGEWDRVCGYADALAAFTAGEPLPWTDFHIDWGRALADHGAGRRDAAMVAALRELRERALAYRLEPALPRLDRALAAAN